MGSSIYKTIVSNCEAINTIKTTGLTFIDKVFMALSEKEAIEMLKKQVVDLGKHYGDKNMSANDICTAVGVSITK